MIKYIYSNYQGDITISIFTIERRKEPRYPACKKVEYSLDESSNNAFPSLLTNISRSGGCLHIYNPLDKDECLLFKNNLDNACQKVKLQWIKEMDRGLYMAGFSGI